LTRTADRQLLHDKAYEKDDHSIEEIMIRMPKETSMIRHGIVFCAVIVFAFGPASQESGAESGCPLDHFAFGQDGGEGSHTGRLFADVSQFYQTTVRKPSKSHYPLNYNASLQAYVNGEPGSAEIESDPVVGLAGERLIDYDIWLEIVDCSDNLWVGVGNGWYAKGDRIQLSTTASHHVHMNYWVWDSVHDPDEVYYVVYRLVDDLEDGQEYQPSAEFWVVLNRAVPGDFDADGHIDDADLEQFEACTTGPAVAYDPQSLPTGCTLAPDDEDIIAADLDRDGDVDQSDFGRFQQCFSGPEDHPDPRCAQ
jgi:hypothetical protein